MAVRTVVGAKAAVGGGVLGSETQGSLERRCLSPKVRCWKWASRNNCGLACLGHREVR